MFRSLLAILVLSPMFEACSSANLRGKSASGQTSDTAPPVSNPPGTGSSADSTAPQPPPSPFPALRDCQSTAPTKLCGLASLAQNLQTVADLGNSQTLNGIRLPTAKRDQMVWQDLTLNASCLSENSFIDVQWDRTVFKGSEMIITELSRSKWNNARFIDSDLRLSHFALAEFNDLQVQNSCLASINWSASHFKNVLIENTFAERGNFSAIQSQGSFQFIKGSLYDANLSGAVFEGAVIFRESDLRGVDLTGVQFKGTVDWQGTRLDGATWMDGRICAPGSVGICN